MSSITRAVKCWDYFSRDFYRHLRVMIFLKNTFLRNWVEINSSSPLASIIQGDLSIKWKMEKDTENVQVVPSPSVRMQGSKNNINQGTRNEMSEVLVMLSQFAHDGRKCSFTGRDGAVCPLVPPLTEFNCPSGPLDPTCGTCPSSIMPIYPGLVCLSSFHSSSEECPC